MKISKRDTRDEIYKFKNNYKIPPKKGEKVCSLEHAHKTLFYVCGVFLHGYNFFNGDYDAVAVASGS